MTTRGLIRIFLGAMTIMSIAAASQLWAAEVPEMSMDGHDMGMHSATETGVTPQATDTRLAVDFPLEFQRQELSNMRDHLEAIQQITYYLAQGDYQAASDTAEQRLTRGGMSEHDRHQAARYMPKAMLAMGAAMHRAAGQFAIVAQDASVSDDMASALKALAEVENHCVACHRAYRMK